MKKLLITTLALLTVGAMTPSMAAGDASAGKGKAAVCAACHGMDGNSPSDMFPKLAGQGEAYLVKQLKEFKSGVRSNAVMAPMVAALSEQDMADLAAYYAGQNTAPAATSEDLVAAGQAVYRAGNKESGVPACMACHGPTGAGVPSAKWPALSGQHAIYIEAQLNLFATGSRSNDSNSMMRDIAAKMTADEIKAVSSYVAGLH
ncbi:c-type cytochrome [uncultured Paraglaciecola sp.]|uniref:c-type cytochrome n=1 Tax=uncultured Paraglaciecola sp. TaxID=1765024 RepID=UPI0025D6E486|nr:c-type cytochrome [uncultured Paraglaciecola sp.]